MTLYDTVKKTLFEYPTLFLAYDWELSKMLVYSHWFSNSRIDDWAVSNKGQEGYLTKQKFHNRKRKFDLPYGKEKFDIPLSRILSEPIVQIRKAKIKWGYAHAENNYSDSLLWHGFISELPEIFMNCVPEFSKVTTKSYEYDYQFLDIEFNWDNPEYVIDYEIYPQTRFNPLSRTRYNDEIVSPNIIKPDWLLGMYEYNIFLKKELEVATQEEASRGFFHEMSAENFEKYKLKQILICTSIINKIEPYLR